MMGRALLTIGWLATLGFAAAGAVGYRAADPETFQLHLLLALVSSLLLLFSHCWILFYLIGTGKAIKEAVAENGLEADIVAATRRFKRQSSGWVMLAILLAMATFVVGGGVYARQAPAWIHHALFYVTAAVQVWTLLREQRVLGANDRLMADIDRRLQPAAAPAAADR
jgi:4-hydroxybenzoate polyprenyltransferase